MDKRWYEVADLLVNHATKIKKGEKVFIAMYEAHTEDLVTAICQKIFENGAYPQVQFLSEKIRNKLLQYGNEEQLQHIPDIEMLGIEWADVYLGIRGAFNLGETWNIESEKRSLNQVVNGKISKARWEQTRWCLIRVPNSDMASQAQIPYERLLDDFFKSCLIDWELKKQEWNKLKEYLEKGKNIRIVADNTDLSFSVENRKWVIFDGTMNLPDGEIATAPITETVNGYIKFNKPAILGGQLFNDVSFKWENGVLIDLQCSNNNQLLKKIISSDSGSSLIGEFAFGLNDALKNFCNDILLDEKINGTIHIALGRAYKECGDINDSSIHWDMVLDTRSKSIIYMDDKKIFENGKFII